MVPKLKMVAFVFVPSDIKTLQERIHVNADEINVVENSHLNRRLVVYLRYSTMQFFWAEGSQLPYINVRE
jgi:hypothetical protein